MTVAVPFEISTITASSTRGTALDANVGDDADEPSTYTVNEMPERLAFTISSMSKPSGRSADESLTVYTSMCQPAAGACAAVAWRAAAGTTVAASAATVAAAVRSFRRWRPGR